jgi:hypothetical protein
VASISWEKLIIHGRVRKPGAGQFSQALLGHSLAKHRRLEWHDKEQVRIPSDADQHSEVMAIAIPKSCRSRFRDDGDHCSDGKPISFGDLRNGDRHVVRRVVAYCPSAETVILNTAPKTAEVPLTAPEWTSIATTVALA